MKTSPMKIGTRSSAMALAQTNLVVAQLGAAHSGLEVDTVSFRPLGDIDQTSKLETHGGKGGAFVAEIRDAMRKGTLSAAMHSLKDMPGEEETPGLLIGAVLKREAVEDVLVLPADKADQIDNVLNTKAAGLKIGTNSVRRAALLRQLFPSTEVIHYRGAVDTRLKKLDQRIPQQLPDGSHVGPADVIVVAKSGLERLGQADRISHVLPAEDFLPAIGQGVVAVECVADDWVTREKLAAIDHGPTRQCVEAEREMLWLLNGHCNAPIAGLARLDGDTIHVRGAVFSESGDQVIEAAASGFADRPREVGRTVALALLEKGAAALLDASRR